MLCQELTRAHIPLLSSHRLLWNLSSHPPWMAPDTRADRGDCLPFTSTNCP